MESWQRALKESEDVSLENLACWIGTDNVSFRGRTDVNMVFYNPIKLQQILKNGMNIDDLVRFYGQYTKSNLIIGIMYMRKASDSNSGPCWGAWEIMRSAVHPTMQGKGFGSALYRLASAYIHQPITSDRLSGTSRSAKKVWQKIEKSSDFEATPPFDDIKNPKTPPPEDDCAIPKFANDPDAAEGTDRAFYLEPGELSKWQSTLEGMINKSKEHEKMPKMTTFLWMVAQDMFRHAYAGNH